MDKKPRYCIQRIIHEEKDKKYKVWETTKICSNDLNTLKLLCGGSRNRIIDTDTGKIVYEV